MNYFFRNPISLLTYKSLNDQNNLRATYVNVKPTRRELPLNIHDLRIQDKHYDISSFICKVLKIELFREEFKDFKKKENIFTESSLLNNWQRGNRVVLWASSEYCYFGFKNYLKYPATKLKLKKLWQPLNLRNQECIYIYNQSNIRVSHKNVKFIDVEKVRSILNMVTERYSPKLLSESNLDCKEQCILFLTHYTDDLDSSFFKSYIEKVIKIAKQEKLKILVKRHKYDLLDYSAFIDKNILARSNQDIINFIPVELFFNLANIKKIIAVPSSSLAFADKSKLNVFVPKRYEEFRREFLHLEPFLKFIACESQKI